ncbi:MAG: VWA domain-containing protein, partial [Clostridia bacterium]|nr:VWA domain-containing protein [Clostridia bacterium]
LYQDMLPVEVINYTPPIAVVIVIDASRSMWYENVVPVYEDSKFYAAKQGAVACRDALTERDYVAVLSLADHYIEELELTPRTQRAKILSAIDEIEIGGSTIYEGALTRARSTLMAQTIVVSSHIILVSDGEPEDSDPEKYLEQVRLNKEAGITMSVVGVQCTPAASQCMIELVTEAGGTSANYHDVVNVRDVPEIMREDLMVPEIKDVNYETFTPTIVSPSSPVMNNITQDNMFTLDGFYGTKAKEGAEMILSSKYVPIYAQWRYGKGMVGSFMCDLNGVWSAEMLSSVEGSTMVKNIVNALFPAENIRVNDIELEIKEGNYNTQLSIFTALEENQSLRVTVTSPDPNDPMSFIEKVYTPGTNGTYSRLTFDVTSSGLHKILVQKLDVNGDVIPEAEATIYRSFSYSAEYDPFHEPSEGEEYLSKLAQDGKGEVIANYDPWGVFENVVKFLRIVIDPRILFMILSLVLFLLDIAVRKFKFKWPHELYHDYQLKKQMNQK